MDETALELDRNAFERAKAHDAFADRCWLTFYLVGSAEAHAAMRSGLVELGGENLSGGEYGFVYAKLPVHLYLHDIEDRVAQVRTLCLETGVSLDLIDLDSSSGVEASKFFTLWQPPRRD